MRVAVVGAGVVGLCTAWYLRKEGFKVVVLDRGGPDSDRCSLGNAGIVVPSHFVPLSAPGMVATGLRMMARRDSPFRIKPQTNLDIARWCWLFSRHCTREHVDRTAPLLLRLNLESRDLFYEFADLWDNAFGFQNKGVLMLCKTPEGLESETEVAQDALRLGLRADILDSGALKGFEAGVATDASGGVHFKDDCHMDPALFVLRLQSELELAGVAFEWGVEATGVSSSPHGVRIETRSGPQEADRAVVAAGTWSGKLARNLGLDLPLQPGKGLNLTLEDEARVPSLPMLLHEARVAVTPMGRRVRFAGTMELGEWSQAHDPVRSRAMTSQIPLCLPDFAEGDFEGCPVWTGLRPCSPDGLPYVGTTKKAPNIAFATGHCMMGLSLGPVTGRLVADQLAGRTEPSPLLSPDRFD